MDQRRPTSTDMASTSLRILPSFPTELHEAILAECDTATLAACCRVSFAFLRAASAWLYAHVDIKTFEQGQLLFRLLVRLSTLLFLLDLSRCASIH